MEALRIQQPLKQSSWARKSHTEVGEAETNTMATNQQRKNFIQWHKCNAGKIRKKATGRKEGYSAVGTFQLKPKWWEEAMCAENQRSLNPEPEAGWHLWKTRMTSITQPAGLEQWPGQCINWERWSGPDIMELCRTQKGIWFFFSAAYKKPLGGFKQRSDKTWWTFVKYHSGINVDGKEQWTQEKQLGGSRSYIYESCWCLGLKY